MIRKLSALWPVRRIAALAVGFWDAFLRDNKVIPPVLAVAALFVFAWIVVGSFIGAPDDEPVSSQNEVAQSDGGGGSQSPAPEIENPNTDSYAAYQSKDPFRQLFETAESTSLQEDATGETTDDGTDATDDTTDTTDDGTGVTDDGATDDGTGGTDDTTFEDTDDGTSDGNPGAADDQYENGQPPREDPTDTPTPGAQTPGAQTPGTQTPAPQTPPGGLFDSGGDLEDPYAP